MIYYIDGNVFKSKVKTIAYEYYEKKQYYSETQDIIKSKYFLEYNDLQYLLKDYRIEYGKCYFSKNLIHMLCKDINKEQYIDFFNTISKNNDILEVGFPKLGLKYGRDFELFLYKKIEEIFKKTTIDVYIFNNHIDFNQGQIIRTV